MFVIGGYLGSDAVFFKRLVRQNNLRTVEDAWNYLGSHTAPARANQVPASGLSARYLLTRQRTLYCDEGALVLATLLRELGYRTCLVDLYSADSQPHHTVLEVNEGGEWHIYDTLFHLRHQPLTNSARHCGFQLSRAVRRPSWSGYRSAVYYNGLVKYVVFKWRGIPG